MGNVKRLCVCLRWLGGAAVCLAASPAFAQSETAQPVVYRQLTLTVPLDHQVIAATAVIVILLGLGAFALVRQVLRTLATQAELRARDQELMRQNERLDIALENMSQALCLFDKDKRLIVCNRRYIDMYDLPARLAEPGTPFRDIVEQRVAAGNYVDGEPASYVGERLAAAEERVPSTKLQELKDGRVIAIAHRPLPDGGWVATHEDITELQRIQAKVAHMANHDALTDLPNRILLIERIVWALLGRRKGGGLAVLYLDLDRFKSVNDTLGHAVGDELLKAVAERLRGCVRAGRHDRAAGRRRVRHPAAVAEPAGGCRAAGDPHLRGDRHALRHQRPAHHDRDEHRHRHRAGRRRRSGPAPEERRHGALRRQE